MGCSLYACKRLRGARRTREYQREREENPAMSSRVFSSFPFYPRTSFFGCNKVASRAHEVTFRICAQPEKHLFNSQCYRAPWKTGCGYPFSVSPVSRARSESASDICDTTLLKSFSNRRRIDDSWQFSKMYVPWKSCSISIGRSIII